ncbi:MAG: zinc ribbon domain-containing protein [Chloroflexota bacterium]|nr:zinc ribbon domain-containing protein [Chloroflexota bacterium]
MYQVTTIVFQTLPLQATSPSESSVLVGWLLGVVLAVGVLVMIARPLLVAEVGVKRRVRQTLTQEEGKIQSLYERASTERKSLEELDFDHELGNLHEEDYVLLKQKTEHKLTKLEQQISQQEETLANLSQGQQAKAKTSKSASAKKTPVSATGTKATLPNQETDGKLKPTIKGAMKCSECATTFKPGDRLCSKCSAPLPLLCLSCGTELKQDDRFCAKCGAAVVN